MDQLLDGERFVSEYSIGISGRVNHAGSMGTQWITSFHDLTADRTKSGISSVYALDATIRRVGGFLATTEHL